MGLYSAAVVVPDNGSAKGCDQAFSLLAFISYKHYPVLNDIVS